MRMCLLATIAVCVATYRASAQNVLEVRGDRILIGTRYYLLTLSTKDGSVISLAKSSDAKPIVTGGEDGLWKLRFRDNTELRASQFSAECKQYGFQYLIYRVDNSVILVYVCAQARVIVKISGWDVLELISEVTARSGTILDFSLPARLRFDPATVRSFVFPTNGNFSVGAAFNRSFFERQSAATPSSWQQKVVGAAGYEALFGGPLDQRPDQDPPTPLRLTAQSDAWLGSASARFSTGVPALVNRPPRREQVDLVLVDSDNGPWFSARRFGEGGRIWRIGGRVEDVQKPLALAAIGAVVERLAAEAPAARNRIGVIALKNGPPSGGWAAVETAQWLERMRSVGAVRSGKKEVLALSSLDDLRRALQDGSYAAIVNPYGEWLPAARGEAILKAVQAVGDYVRAGGNWFETGGYPFFSALRPVEYYSISEPYPAAFADFMHLDCTPGSVSIYRDDGARNPPWSTHTHTDHTFVPSQLTCGGDERGGYCEHLFRTYVAEGKSWSTPHVVLAVGRTTPEALADYRRANDLTSRLRDKLSPQTLAKLKQSVLVYYGGSARQKLDNLTRLPVPSLVHFADYLHGGFDKQYPDHLPPNPSFGTPEEMKAYFEKARALGHLVMPYTNPTWWCEGPKGPTFEAAGDAPLLKTLDGGLNHEQYAANGGYTITFWHPAVQAANRKTVTQFTQEYPVDMLFQDQCGARGWSYDTNPASPNPLAYTEGLLSMVREDAKKVPLSTEAGWDLVSEYESQLCGMSWQIVPTEGAPAWLVPMKIKYPPSTWTLFPLAEYIAHDKASMIHHDLGQFVTNEPVLSWTLALGFGLSFSVQASALAQDAPREWLNWLARLQKSICALYVGEPVVSFEHIRGPNPTAEDDGVVRARYGPVAIDANLGPNAKQVDERTLPPFGFHASAPGCVAGVVAAVGLADGVGFVARTAQGQTDLWVYGEGGAAATVELPGRTQGSVSVTWDSGPSARGTIFGGKLSLRIPSGSSTSRVSTPHDLAGRPPVQWPKPTPSIAVLDFPGLNPVWTKIGPQDWLRAFQQCRLVREGTCRVETITDAQDLLAALKLGPSRYVTIVNPYGEVFPVAGRSASNAMLDAIRHYVEHGGSWWETGGLSLNSAIPPSGDPVVGAGGLGKLGVPIAMGDLEAAPSPLTVAQAARAWLGDELSARVAKLTSQVNRSLPRGGEDPGHFALVAGPTEDFIGGYRLNGCGWFWRIGGMNPNPDVALPVVVAATEYQYTHVAPPAIVRGTKKLWHAVVHPSSAQ